MVDIVGDVFSYFTYCPLCYSYWSIVIRESDLSGLGGKDHIICASCGAKWHIKRGKWARLVKTSLDGSGSKFIQKRHNFEFWQKMAYEGLKTIIEEEKKAEEEPLRILQLRYSKGEITREKYEEMKKTLES